MLTEVSMSKQQRFNNEKSKQGWTRSQCSSHTAKYC